MTDQDRAAFAELMLGISETFSHPVSDTVMELYFRALQDLPLEALRVAATIHVRTAKFFPRPAELREAIEGSTEDAAEIAWVTLLRLVRSVGYYGTPTWTDDATRRAALELFGGWQALCSSLPAEGPELLGCAKNFKSVYRAYAKRAAFQERIALPSGVLGMLES
jgi:hypothetical protein